MSSISHVFSIVPVWFSERVEADDIRRLLTLTVEGSERLALPRNQFLYIDGAPHVVPIAGEILRQYSPEARLTAAPENLGKGAGIRKGLEQGLKEEDIHWFMIRDADGDHRVDDGSALLELGTQIESECGNVPVLVIGGRSRLEPPLTLYRAAYEEILNRTIDAALGYVLASRNHVPDRTYYRHYGNTPDIQSGYKLYNRKAAELVVDGFDRAREKDVDVFRWGAEIVPYVSVVILGGIVGERRRSTYREQPVTAYGSIQRAEFYAQKLHWVFTVCGLNLWNSTRILDNELTYTPLMFDGMGRTELLAFRKAVLTPLKRREADEVPPFRSGVQFL